MPTSFDLSGAIAMLRSTYCFVAGPLPAGPEPTAAVAGFVSRWIPVTGLNVPATVATTSAFAVNVPAVALLIVNVQVTVDVPSPLGEPQVEDCDVGPGVTLGVIAAAVIGPPTEVTVIVNT